MATFVNDLRLKEIATGDESGSWGTSTNTNLELIAEAMGLGAETIPNASTHTITMADGTSDEFRSLFLRLTGGGTACTVTLAPNTLSHTWVMRNETAAALTLTQGSGANVIIAAGQTKIVATDGAGSGAAVYEMDDLELAGNLDVSGALTGTTAVFTTDGNTTQLTLKSTDADASVGPRLDLTRDSASPAANDTIGVLRFLGNDSAGGSFSYALIQGFIEDPTDGSEDGKLVIETRLAGSNRERISMDATELVINESSRDLDFRVESNVNTHALFVQGSDGNVGIGTTSPTGNLEIATSASDTGVDLVLDGNKTSNGGIGSIIFNNNGDSVGMIRSNRASANDAADMLFYTQATGGANTERMRIDSSGNLLQGTTVIPTGVQSSRQLISSSATGAEIIAYREDNGVEVNDFCGAFLIGNDDNSGTEDHFAGMWGQVSTVSGNMDLKFAAGRENYESGSPHMTLDYDGNLGIGIDSPSAGGVGGKVIHVQNSGATASVRVDRSDASTSGTLSITSGNGSCSLFGTGAKPLNFATNSVTRMTIDSEGQIKPAAGSNIGTLQNLHVSIGTSATLAIDMGDAVTSDKGAGMYMVTIVRTNGSYGRNFVGIFGVNSSSVILYETLRINGITVTVSGTQILGADNSSGTTYDVNAMPLVVDKDG